MKYTQKAGAKEFIFVLIWVAAAALIGDLVRYLAPEPPMLKDLVIIAIGCVMVYLIYTRYCAQFVYTLGEEGLSIEKKTGRRIKSAYVRYDDIDSVLTAKPKKKFKMQSVFVKSIIKSRDKRYICCKEQLFVIETDEQFIKGLKEKING